MNGHQHLNTHSMTEAGTKWQK